MGNTVFQKAQVWSASVMFPGIAPVSEFPSKPSDVGSSGLYCFHPEVCGPLNGSTPGSR